MTPYTLPLLAAATIAAAVSVLAWRRRPSRGAVAFSALMLLVVVNILVSLALLGSTSLDSFLFWVKMSFAGGGLGVAWLVFTLRYDGRSLRDVTRIGVLVAVEPAAVFVLAWFNDLHHLLWTQMSVAPVTIPGSLLHVDTSFGPLYWVWSACQYTLLLAGVVVLMRNMYHARSAYRGQTIAVLVAMAVPWAANALFLIGYTFVTGVDLTPFAFALSGVALFFALYRFRFLDLVPIPRSLVLEASPNGVLVLDARGRIVDVNTAAEGILGCSAQQVLGIEGVLVLPALSSAAPDADIELAFVQNGVERSYDLHVAPLRKHMGTLVQLTDVTDRKRMAARLLQAQKMDALGLMAGGIAHDFNNLLTGILGNISIVRDLADRSEPIAEPLAQAEKAARRAAGLTHNLLTFSRSGSPSPTVVDLNESVDLTLQSIAGLIPSTMRIVRDFAPGVWNVLVDQVQFGQLAINLVLNARDAMDGMGTLTVRTGNVDIDEPFVQAHPEARAGEHVLLQFTDTGRGMSDAVRQHLFEPFFTTKPVGQGTGLGLAVVYGAVQQARGWIIVDTAAGEGTVFSTYLPRCREPAQDPAVQETRVQRVPANKTIMVVDDEEMILLLTRRMLERAGYKVIAAPDGPSAIASFQQDPAAVDLVLLDMTMPHMTGDQVLWELRRLGCKAPILISSGYSLGDSIQQLVGAPGGADGFLPKPYSIQELSDAVSAALESVYKT
ncbi:MAG TPA: histidine kinase N-terminal 7TM domain-containing protein [Clostridia bacterium]|nr:histidine kinase N-terminal 7TM domain-containing protein [Clostridia bacterium]